MLNVFMCRVAAFHCEGETFANFFARFLLLIDLQSCAVMQKNWLICELNPFLVYFLNQGNAIIRVSYYDFSKSIIVGGNSVSSSCFLSQP
jgi:hypothetical protein